MSATTKPYITTRGAIWGGILKLLHYLFNFTDFVIISQSFLFYCVAKCVVFNKKVSFRKPLKLTYINWLRELDLNQRPSGYEPDELPDCSIPRYLVVICVYSFEEQSGSQTYLSSNVTFSHLLVGRVSHDIFLWCQEINLNSIIMPHKYKKSSPNSSYIYFFEKSK